VELFIGQQSKQFRPRHSKKRRGGSHGVVKEPVGRELALDGGQRLSAPRMRHPVHLLLPPRLGGMVGGIPRSHHVTQPQAHRLVKLVVCDDIACAPPPVDKVEPRRDGEDLRQARLVVGEAGLRERRRGGGGSE